MRVPLRSADEQTLISNEEGSGEEKERNRRRLIALAGTLELRARRNEQGRRNPCRWAGDVRASGPTRLPVRRLRGEPQCPARAMIAARGAAAIPGQPGSR